MNPERLQRAQRAIFEAIGQIAIVERLLAGLDEPGQFGQGRRRLTIADPESRFNEQRRDVQSELQKMSGRLEQIDERIEELTRPRVDERPELAPIEKPRTP